MSFTNSFIEDTLSKSLFPIGIYAYVILKDGVDDDEQVIEEDLKKLIKTQIGSFAVPQQILVSISSTYDKRVHKFIFDLCNYYRYLLVCQRLVLVKSCVEYYER